ncbi:hypothetical protein HZC07_05780 [Candidatus Micrarchaeota archaeon]|nr:hypothetical protein [Candidatus Micrarchaeota archaeon]
MKSKLFLVFLVLIGFAIAFNLNTYLYPSELNGSISYINFTSSGSNYSIIKINGNEVFLLQNGTPVTNQSVIGSVLRSYYLTTYYPNQSEIDSLNATIKKFNDSRNDGYDFRNKEEYVCRDDVLLSTGKLKSYGKPILCTDFSSCKNLSAILFALYSGPFSLGSESQILVPLMSFTLPSIEMDAILANYTNKLSNLNETSVSDTTSYILSTVGTLKNDSYKIESSIFRTPRLNDSADRLSCKDCWGVCPSFDLDQTAIDSIKNQSLLLSAKVAPLKNYNNISAIVYNNTLTRFQYAQDESSAVNYSSILSPLVSAANNSILLGQEAARYVSNSTLSSSLDQLTYLHLTIPKKISARNFTNIDGDLNNYQLLTARVNASASILLSEYNVTLHAKNSADLLVLALETKDLDPSFIEEVASIQNTTDTLDSTFRPGLTEPVLLDIQNQYVNLSNHSQTLLASDSNTPATKSLSLFRSFSRRVNLGIAALADATQLIPSASVPVNSLLIFGGFSGLLFLSFSAISVLVVLYIYISINHNLPRVKPLPMPHSQNFLVNLQQKSLLPYLLIYVPLLMVMLK